MKEELEAAKDAMQKTVDRVLEPGARAVVDFGGGAGDFVAFSVDRFEILFARPRLGMDGAVESHYFWAACFAVGFDEGGPQHVHLFRMDGVKKVRTGLIEFADQAGRKCLLESVDEIDAAAMDDFRRWRDYKGKNRAAFDRLYREFGEEMTEMALNWEKDAA